MSSSILQHEIAQAKRTAADIVLGTDPDSDRVGIAVKVADGEYQLMTGNQVGALLMDFVLDNTDLSALAHIAGVVLDEKYEARFVVTNQEEYIERFKNSKYAIIFFK